MRPPRIAAVPTRLSLVPPITTAATSATAVRASITEPRNQRLTVESAPTLERYDPSSGRASAALLTAVHLREDPGTPQSDLMRSTAPPSHATVLRGRIVRP